MQGLLKYIDVVIGLALVMLLASTVVTAVTQVINNSTFARALFLRRGLRRLVERLDPDLNKHSAMLADAVVRHPMIGREGNWVSAKLAQWMVPGSGGGALIPGNVVDREEFVRILLEIAAGEAPLIGPEEQVTQMRADLAEALRKSGLADPHATLSEIRRLRIQLELDHPQLPQAVWHAQAVMRATACDFVGKVNSWFDNTMARVVERFSARAKLITAVISLVFVAAIQLDIRELVSRLWADDALRAELVNEVGRYEKRVDDERSRAAALQGGAKQQSESQAIEDQQRLSAVDRAVNDMRISALALVPEHPLWEGVARAHVEERALAPDLATTKLRLVLGDEKYPLQMNPVLGPMTALKESLSRINGPFRVDSASSTAIEITARQQAISLVRLEAESSPGVWSLVSNAQPRRAFSMDVFREHLPGVLVAWILVSLGTTFWYDALKNLLKFRSVLAQKESNDREQRDKVQEIQAAPAVKPSKPAIGKAE